ncbi:uncharacterized protein N7459_007487 [Penicillium hispanicum]|uniref:uncharacterized protein n=1 Tax=Penicillium hispanicum TaxID=1080232 RepID=UPI0025407C8F|nr:uncharacterized protein N7459_007487 [Penicillium hispanicum]KAJ5578523.1 hypothetical protein N7459_007487 [Penicillium hispanicum]
MADQPRSTQGNTRDRSLGAAIHASPLMRGRYYRGRGGRSGRAGFNNGPMGRDGRARGGYSTRGGFNSPPVDQGGRGRGGLVQTPLNQEDNLQPIHGEDVASLSIEPQSVGALSSHQTSHGHQDGSSNTHHPGGTLNAGGGPPTGVLIDLTEPNTPAGSVASVSPSAQHQLALLTPVTTGRDDSALPQMPTAAPGIAPVPVMLDHDARPDNIVTTEEIIAAATALHEDRVDLSLRVTLPIMLAVNVPKAPEGNENANDTVEPKPHESLGKDQVQNDLIDDITTENDTRVNSQKPKMSWKEAIEKAKVIGAPIIKNARKLDFAHPDRPYEAARPGLLPVFRNGPGQDLASDVYNRDIARNLFAEGVEEPEAWSVSPPAFIPDEGYEEVDPEVNWHTIRRGTAEYHTQWKAYKASPRLYPMIINKELVLTPTLPHDHKYDEQPFPTTVSNPKSCPQMEFGPCWNFCPTTTWNREGYRAWFYRWLDNVPTCCCTVDIFHSAFFDGTASPDGGYSMMVQDIKNLMTPRDLRDKETRLHWHETSSGFMHNMGLYLKSIGRDGNPENEANEPWASISNLEPKSIHANAFLRPVEYDDCASLLKTFNWYAERSPLSVEILPMEAHDVREVITTCEQWNLPFIVAVQRKEDNEGAEWISLSDEILGYAYVKPFATTGAEQYVGELQVFMHPSAKKKNIGWALVDMILSIMDVRYPRGSPRYKFRPSEQHAYVQGSMRTLTTLLCALSYPSSMEESFKWTKEWLKKEFNFEEQGVIKEARMKFGKRYGIDPLFRRDVSC